jgi:hypothetical protein
MAIGSGGGIWAAKIWTLTRGVSRSGYTLFFYEIEFFQGHEAQACRVANAALRQCDDFLRDQARRRIVTDFQTERVTHANKGILHVPNCFGLEGLTGKKRRDLHDAAKILTILPKIFTTLPTNQCSGTGDMATSGAGAVGNWPSCSEAACAHTLAISRNSCCCASSVASRAQRKHSSAYCRYSSEDVIMFARCARKSRGTSRPLLP